MKKVVILFLFLIPFVSAHLADGEDVVTDGFLIDLGYEPAEIVAGSPTLFAINLVNASTEEIIEPEKVWVRISDPDEVYFSGTFFPDAGNAAFTYTFPKEGSFDLTVRFSDPEGVLVEHTFDVEVSGRTISSTMIAAIFLIFIGLILFLKKRKKNV